jgi:hypothetical protein
MNFIGRIALVLGLLAGTLSVHGQPRDRRDDRERDHDDRHGRGGPRVIVYQDADFRGDRLVLYPGDSLDNLSRRTFERGGRINDRISSIRVEGGAEIYLHADYRFTGSVMRLTENARDLTVRLLPGSVTTSWNDRISSLRVEARRRNDSRLDADTIVRRAYGDLLAREPDAVGLRDYRSLIIDQGWTEAMVRDNIRGGDEFRQEGADRIVRRAYLDILGREVDAEGLKHFRRQLVEKGWTESDLRDALRQSEEYRKSGGRR